MNRTKREAQKWAFVCSHARCIAHRIRAQLLLGALVLPGQLLTLVVAERCVCATHPIPPAAEATEGCARNLQLWPYATRCTHHINWLANIPELWL